jgi:hypothetical protein
MNGKAERFFKTLKWWQRLKLLFTSERSIQKKLDVFQEWYNIAHPMWALGMRTPEEVWNNVALEQPVLIPEADPVKPAICVRKQAFEGDPLLPVLDMDVVWRKRLAA